jgi:hypothetical protein
LHEIQTLDKIYQQLLSLIKELDGVVSQRDAVSSVTLTNLLRLRVLLWFVDALDKQIVKAYALSSDGTSGGYSKQIVMFFATNRSVCETWFARIRKLAVYAGRLLGAWHDVSALVSKVLSCGCSCFSF